MCVLKLTGPISVCYTIEKKYFHIFTSRHFFKIKVIFSYLKTGEKNRQKPVFNIYRGVVEGSKNIYSDKS